MWSETVFSNAYDAVYNLAFYLKLYRLYKHLLLLTPVGGWFLFLLFWWQPNPGSLSDTWSRCVQTEHRGCRALAVGRIISPGSAACGKVESERSLATGLCGLHSSWASAWKRWPHRERTKWAFCPVLPPSAMPRVLRSTVISDARMRPRHCRVSACVICMPFRLLFCHPQGGCCFCA